MPATAVTDRADDATAVGFPWTKSPEGRRGPRQWPVGWPLFALFGGYPIWWALGIGEASCLIFAIPMARYLLRAKTVIAPRGLGWWLLFVVWVLGGVLVLQVHAPGTIPAVSYSRYATFGYRYLFYIAATVVLLYVGNTVKELSTRRVSLALSNMFVVVTGGGILGTLQPHLQFRSALEYVLPGPLRSNGFVHGLIHPVTAQVQDFLGYEEARPSAPFAYTNQWGLAVACFLPFFVITWCRRDAGWRRTAAPFVLVLATITVILSLNRGLWLALATMGLFVAVRYALLGQLKVLGFLLAGVAAIGALVLFSPLGSLVLDRFAHPNSNQGRSNLGSLTLSSVLNGSPVMGFGTTRNVLGNFASIASAATAQCPGCSPPPLGTQGQLWAVLFGQGLVGLFFYVMFFASQLVRHLRLQSPDAVAGMCVLIAAFATIGVYNLTGPTLFAIMISVALFWRGDMELASASPGRLELTAQRQPPAGPTIGWYFSAARRRLVPLLLFASLGAGVGVLYHSTAPAKVNASTLILIPDVSATPRRAPPTLDTAAQLATADEVLTALSRSQPGLTRLELAGRLHVSATPNTRILHITYTSSTPRSASVGVRAATAAYVRVLTRVTGEFPLDRGRIISETPPRRAGAGRLLSASTGGVSALAMGLVYGHLIGARRVRARRRRGRGADSIVGGLPVIAEINGGLPAETTAEWQRACRQLRSQDVSSVLSAAKSPEARSVAAALDVDVRSPGERAHAGSTAVVISTKTRLGELTDLQATLAHGGQSVAGIVVVSKK